VKLKCAFNQEEKTSSTGLKSSAETCTMDEDPVQLNLASVQ
jgi:hypothetical protein